MSASSSNSSSSSSSSSVSGVKRPASSQQADSGNAVDDDAVAATSQVNAATAADEPRKKAGLTGDSAAATAAAAAAHSSASSPPAVSRLYADVLGKILSFLPLQDQMVFSRVGRKWAVVGRASPQFVAWRSLSALSKRQWRNMMALLKQQDAVRVAAARVPHIVHELKNYLREEKCLSVASPLLTLLRTLVVLRPAALEARSGNVQVQVTLPGASSAAAAAAGAANVTDTVQLHVEWQREDDLMRGQQTTESSISFNDPETDKRERKLFSYTSHSDHIGGETRCEADALTEWLRSHGLLSGSVRQQSHLTYAFSVALFQAASGWDDVEGDIIGGRACGDILPSDAADAEPEAAEPEGSSSEEEDDDGSEEGSDVDD